MLKIIQVQNIEWYSSHCCVCGQKLWNSHKKEYEIDTWQCDIEMCDGRTVQRLICEDCHNTKEVQSIIDIKEKEGLP